MIRSLSLSLGQGHTIGADLTSFAAAVVVLGEGILAVREGAASDTRLSTVILCRIVYTKLLEVNMLHHFTIWHWIATDAPKIINNHLQHVDSVYLSGVAGSVVSCDSVSPVRRHLVDYVLLYGIK